MEKFTVYEKNLGSFCNVPQLVESIMVCNEEGWRTWLLIRKRSDLGSLHILFLHGLKRFSSVGGKIQLEAIFI